MTFVKGRTYVHIRKEERHAFWRAFQVNCGERIAKLRENHGLTQGELAKRLNITRASLSHYETNRRQPDYALLSEIADLFHVSVDYLIGRVGEPQGAYSPEEVALFVNQLELSDHKILEIYDLTIDGRKLSKEEALRFIAFVRAERSLNISRDTAD